MNEFLLPFVLFLGTLLVFFHWFKDRRKLVIKTQIFQNKYEEINVGGWTQAEEPPVGEG